MTQLTDKMDWRSALIEVGAEITTHQDADAFLQSFTFNEAQLLAFLELVKAEAVVAGDWEAEIEKYKEPTELNGTVYYQLPINKLTHLLTAEREAGAREAAVEKYQAISTIMNNLLSSDVTKIARDIYNYRDRADSQLEVLTPPTK